MSDKILIKKGLSLLLSSKKSPLATWEWHVETDTVTCSEAFFNILNINSDKRFITVEEQLALFPLEDLKQLVPVIEDAMNDGKPFETEIRLLNEQKELKECVVLGFPVVNRDNELISIHGTVRDISEMKTYNAKLREQQQYQKEILDSGNEGIFILDVHTHKIVDGNKTVEKITGYTRDELSKKTITELCSDEPNTSQDKITAYLKRTIVDDLPQIFECRIDKKNGNQVWLEMYARYVEINKLERILLSARDISERKKHEKSNAINELRQRFLINISLFKAKSLSDLLDYILGEVLKDLNSTFGYLQYYSNDKAGLLITKNLKDRFEPLSKDEKSTLKLIDNPSVWSDIVLLRRAVIDNNFNVLNHLKDLFSEEMISPLKYMSIPIFKEHRIVATIGVANTKRDYSNLEVEQLTYFMDSVWDIIDVKEFSQKSRTDEHVFQSAVMQSPLVIEQYNKDGIQIAANAAYEKLWGFPASTTVSSFNILKSIEIRNSGLYEYVLKGYEGKTVVVPDYIFNPSSKPEDIRWFSSRIYPIKNELEELTGITITHEDVTVRKQQDEKSLLKMQQIQNQSRLNDTIINAIPVRLFWKDENAVYRGCNILFARDAGLSKPDELIGKTDEDLNWGRELFRIRSKDMECLTEENILRDLVERFIDVKGEEVWIRSTVQPFHLTAKGHKGILGMYDDITEIKNAEKALVANLDKADPNFFSLAELIKIENLEEIYSYISGTLQHQFPWLYVAFTSVNHSETKLTVKSIQGLNDTEKEQLKSITNYNVYGKNLSVYPANYEIYKKGKLIEFTGGMDLYFGIQFPSADARKIENLLSINYIYTLGINQGDKLLGVLHFFAKKSLTKQEKSLIESMAMQSAFVIERKTLDSKVSTSLDHIYKTIETASDAIVIAEAKTGIIAASNDKSEYFFNRDTEDMVGFHYSILFPSPYRDEYNKLFADALKNNEPPNGEFWIEQYKGEHKPVIISSTYIISNNKVYVMLVFHDIGKRKEAEALAVQENKELQQLISTKDKLFSIISHDLKNPLTGIVGFAEVVKDELPDDDDGQLIKFMDIIIRSADSMVYLINNLLHWSRIQQGVISAKFTKVELYDVVEREFELLFTAANNKSIDLVNRIEMTTLVYGDKEMLSTVIRNLVSNAIKFTPNEGTVTVSGKSKGEILEVSVTDTGIGMEQAVADKLFRINNDTQRKGTAGEKGTGLGLVICKDFVEQNHGKIWVESTINKGTTFYFTVPVFNG